MSINTKFALDSVTPVEYFIDNLTKGYQALAISVFEIEPKIITKSNGTNIVFMATGENPFYAELCIYDTVGRKILTLLNGNITPGFYEIPWDGYDAMGRQVRNGLYIVQIILNCDGQRTSSVSKLIVLN